MATIKSLFGVYSDNLQAVLDSAKDQYAPLWFPRFFTWDTPQLQLSFVEAIGRSRIEAAASVVHVDAKAPVRSRQALDKLNGEVPAISEKFHMDSATFRNFLWIREASNLDPAAKKQAILDLLFDDAKKVVDANLKRVDYMCLEGVSTGQFTLTTTNNPDGLVAPTAIDLLMPAGNKVSATVNWDTVATAKPISVDILGIVNAARLRGIKFRAIMMDWTTYFKFIAIQETKDMYSAWIGKTGAKLVPTLDSLNALLQGQQMPPIEIVDQIIGVEKDGVITSLTPWQTTNIVFIPDGPLGKIKNAISVEEMNKVPQVSYAKQNNVLVSKWGENDPYQEWTKGELLAIPFIQAIDAIYLLSRTLAY